MTLKTKIKCSCQSEFTKQLHPEYVDRPYLCIWCRGSGEWEATVRFEKFDGKFKRITDWLDEYQEDLYVSFKCPCGDEITLLGDIVACSCGRVYHFNYKIEKNETYLNEPEKVIEIFKKER